RVCGHHLQSQKCSANFSPETPKNRSFHPANCGSWVSRLPNGCRGSRGIGLDEKRGFLFAGCDEGRLSVLDIKTGRILGPRFCRRWRRHYCIQSKASPCVSAGRNSGTTAIVGISASGTATVLKTAATVDGATV